MYTAYSLFISNPREREEWFIRETDLTSSGFGQLWFENSLIEGNYYQTLIKNKIFCWFARIQLLHWKHSLAGGGQGKWDRMRRGVRGRGQTHSTEDPEVAHDPQLPLTLRASVGSAPRKGLPSKGKVSALLCWGCAVTWKAWERQFWPVRIQTVQERLTPLPLTNPH